MLLTPFLSGAILARHWRWPELAAFIAILCSLAIKDPLVAMARQRWIWKQEHAETAAARRFAGVEMALLCACGWALVSAWGWRRFLPVFAAAGAFTVLAVWINVRNRQRSEWFQIASAAALTSTALVACLSVEGSVAPWAWRLWALCALQAAAGIFVVHSRLDAVIAARKHQDAESGSRRAAVLSVAALALSACGFASVRTFWIAAALLTAAAGYAFELRRQGQAAALQLPLKRVGQQALALSALYAAMIVAGLWS